MKLGPNGRAVCDVPDPRNTVLDHRTNNWARSDVELFTMLGAKVRLCAPRTLLPAGVAAWPVDVFSAPAAACAGADAVICLRL